MAAEVDEKKAARRSYKTAWARGRRMAEKIAGSNPPTVTVDIDAAQQLGQDNDTDDDESYLAYYIDPVATKAQIAFFKKRIYELQHPQETPTVDLSPPALHVDPDATEAYRADLNAMALLPLTERAEKLSYMGQKLENIGRYFTHKDVIEFRDRLRKESDILKDRRERVAYYDRMIPQWEKGGFKRLEQEAMIRIDRQTAQAKLLNGDNSIKREGVALLNSCDRRVGQIEVTLGALKAERDALLK
jgi:hypothetical protein